MIGSSVSLPTAEPYGTTHRAPDGFWPHDLALLLGGFASIARMQVDPSVSCINKPLAPGGVDAGCARWVVMRCAFAPS